MVELGACRVRIYMLCTSLPQRSDEIQSVVRAPKAAGPRHGPLKKNPLRNLGAMLKLNPYAKVARRIAATSSAKNGVKRADKLAKLAAGQVVGPKKPAELKKVKD
jgi:large subunit ribosomal protein L4e